MRLIISMLVAVAVSCSIGITSLAADEGKKPPITTASPFKPVLGEKGMVVSQEKYASMAGRDVLKAGGNAVDAAVATGFALAVTHPQAGNIGGGGFMLVYLAAEKRTIALDYREMAPAAAHKDLFLDADGNVDSQRALFSAMSSGVPGTVMGLLEAHSRYGRLSRAEVMAPAIRLAAEGFPMTWALHDALIRYEDRMKADAASSHYFYKADGSLYQPGELFVQKDLATTLKRIARKGANGFYKGTTADHLVAAMQAGGGIITHADLAAYRVRERTPVSGTYDEYQVVSMPPPSSGGIHIIQMLNILEDYDLKEMGHNSADYIHLLAESMKRAYADRSKFLGDPDFIDVPVDVLTSKSYAAALRGSINTGKATASADILPGAAMPKESRDTTHFSVMDSEGNAVSNTYTVNLIFGSGKSVAGAGFLLNNEMDDFSSKPGVPNVFGLVGGAANAIEAGKRPLSSMTPTLVLKDGIPVIASGSPGGSTIITATFQTVLNILEFDMNPAEATAMPRIHHQWLPDNLFFEPGISIDTIRLLKARGQPISGKPFWSGNHTLGKTQTIVRRPDGLFAGAADPRGPGSYAAAY